MLQIAPESVLLAGGADALPHLILFFVLIAGLALAQRLRKPTTRRGGARGRRHTLYLSRARRLLKEIRAVGPRQNPGRVFHLLRAVNPYVFEELLLCEIERRGVKVYRSPSYSGDGGVDGAFDLNGDHWLVQAKRYRATSSRHTSGTCIRRCWSTA
jgi:restriction system protein